MPKYYIKTVVEYYTEGEYDNEIDAEAAGWIIDELNYGGVESITVEELEDDEYDDEDDEEDED